MIAQYKKDKTEADMIISQLAENGLTVHDVILQHTYVPAKVYQVLSGIPVTIMMVTAVIIAIYRIFGG